MENSRKTFQIVLKQPDTNCHTGYSTLVPFIADQSFDDIVYSVQCRNRGRSWLVPVGLSSKAGQPRGSRYSIPLVPRTSSRQFVNKESSLGDKYTSNIFTRRRCIDSMND